MNSAHGLYIDGSWRASRSSTTIDVVNPATEQVIASIGGGTAEDVDLAVAAARRGFVDYSMTSVADRLAVLNAVIAAYSLRVDELADVVSDEMGAPLWLARSSHVAAGLGHLQTLRDVLGSYEFETMMGHTVIERQPVGVCGLITPWNLPLNQIACKVAPALAAGCSIVLKPSEIAPLSALMFADILHESGVPSGVFNLVSGDGRDVGGALARHPDVDMISITGSTRAGTEVAIAAAPTVKRITQELGGKSANIILDDADFEVVIPRDVLRLCRNSGQTCSAPSRMLVPVDRMDEAADIARRAAEAIVVGDPRSEDTQIGPVASQMQFDRVQALIGKGIAEGAHLVAGGLGRPDGTPRGFYVKPTVFSRVSNDMTVAQEEIFGPVLVLIAYKDDDDAIRIANDSRYGLCGYVSGTKQRATAVARRIRAGQISVNGAPADRRAPFGGFRQSGNGREWGHFGMEEFLEVRAIFE